MDETKKFTEWHGIPRDKVNWGPEIDSKKCIGCGLCAVTCGRGVYKFDYAKRKPVVAKPLNCLVACQTCANLCPAGAISFAKQGEGTREKAQKLVAEHGILPKVRGELEKRKEELSV